MWRQRPARSPSSACPALAYEQDFRFLQLVIGYLIGRVIISVLLIPQYFRGDLVTAYQLIERRFGQRLRSLTAGLFLITRAAAEGVRVFAVAIVVGIALGNLLGGFSDFGRDVAAIAIVSLLTLIYTFEGGMAAVIWTDVVQLAVYVAGTLAGFFTILHLVPGGWHTVHSVAAQAGKFRVFDFSWNFYADLHLLVRRHRRRFPHHGQPRHRSVDRAAAALRAQRTAIQDRAAGQRRHGPLPVLAVPADWRNALCLLQIVSACGAFTRSDTIFPTFVVTRMPHGVSGLLISAILAAAMANLSAALNSLSSTTIVDFYSRMYPQASEKRRVFLSRVATVGWGVVLFALAIVARSGGKVLEVGLSIASVAYGSLLGVFLLGVLTRRPASAARWSECCAAFC